MKAVWKFPLPVVSDCAIIMPVGAQILTVQIQRGEPFLWALVDPGMPGEVRNFHTCGTGHNSYAELGRYVGTFQLHNGSLVFHVFEAQPL